MKTLLLFLIVLFSSYLGAPTRAAMEIRLDLEEGKDPGGNWNVIDTGQQNNTTSNLKDFNTGLPTVVDTTGSGWGSFSHSEPWGVDVDWLHKYASEDGWAGAPASDPKQIFTSLRPNGRYRVEVNSCYGSSDFGTITIKVNGTYADTNYRDNMSGEVSKNWDMLDAFNNQDWVIWSSVAADGTGKIEVSAVKDAGGWGILNAVRLVEIPPSGTVFRIR